MSAVSSSQLYMAHKHDSEQLSNLRAAMRQVVVEVIKISRYEPFAIPYSLDRHHPCWNRIKEPVDLSTILSRIDAHEYSTETLFLQDISLIHHVSGL